MILHIFAPLAALSCAVLHWWGGEKENQAGTGEQSGLQTCQSFLSVLPESAKTSSLPSLPSSLPASQSLQLLAPFRTVPRVRKAVFHTRAQLRAIATLPFSCECAPCPAAWGGPGVHSGSSPRLSCSLALPGCKREAHVRLEHVPWAVPLQKAHLRAAVWGDSRWGLPAPIAFKG